MWYTEVKNLTKLWFLRLTKFLKAMLLFFLILDKEPVLAKLLGFSGRQTPRTRAVWFYSLYSVDKSLDYDSGLQSSKNLADVRFSSVL